MENPATGYLKSRPYMQEYAGDKKDASLLQVRVSIQEINEYLVKYGLGATAHV